MIDAGLLRVARDLAVRADSDGSDYRVAISTAYYALFHRFAGCCADALIGEEGPNRTERAWLQAYRSFNHGAVSAACKRVLNQRSSLGFPEGILNFARCFPSAQSLRHRADYDPVFSPGALDAIAHLEAITEAAEALGATPTRHVRAFAAYVLFEQGRKNIERDGT